MMGWLALAAIIPITPAGLGGDLSHAQRFAAHLDAWCRARDAYEVAEVGPQTPSAVSSADDSPPPKHLRDYRPRLNLNACLILLGLAVLAATIAYLGRYRTGPAIGARIYIMDRWTGVVSVCIGIELRGCSRVFPPP
jgi:hypothetical protein